MDTAQHWALLKNVSPRLLETLQMAQTIARENDWTVIDTGCLLRAMLRLNRGHAAEFLEAKGITEREFRQFHDAACIVTRKS